MFTEDLNIIIAFVIAFISLLVLDLKFIGKNNHEIKFKEASIWTGVFIMVSLAFCGYIYYDLGSAKAIEFITAYTIEKILSVDNLFVFILIFSYFKVPKELHHKVLFYGIIGAVVFRAIFIFTGVKLISLTQITMFGLTFNYLIILFGLFLLLAGIKAVFSNDDDETQDFNNSIGAKLVRKLFPRLTSDFGDGRFFVKIDGVRWATQMLVVVAIIEFSDVLFAVDSIPAIIAISDDPFILYTSNVFAILGLRSMYFLLANLLPMFKYLETGVAIILAFIGLKMVASPFIHVDSLISLLVVLGVLITSVVISLIKTK